jgi:hypothetical protein
VADQEVLYERLRQLEMNHHQLMETLSKIFKPTFNNLTETIFRRYAAKQHDGNDGLTPATA